MSLVGDGISVRLGGRDVLSKVSLSCGKGRITGLIGPNGAGKSTLMRALAGLVPVARGTVLLDGASLAAMTADERGRHLAYLPQDRVAHWPLAVHRVVALGRLPHRRAGPLASDVDEAGLIGAAMAAMDVAHLADRPVSELSGGERARVLFARTLAQEAPVILADEPTAGLDPAHALGLFEVLGNLAAKGRTIVVALHDLSLAARFCHEVVMMATGRVVATGPPAEALTEARLAEVFGAHMVVGVLGGVPAVVPLSPVARNVGSGDADRR